MYSNKKVTGTRHAIWTNGKILYDAMISDVNRAQRQHKPFAIVGRIHYETVYSHKPRYKKNVRTIQSVPLTSTELDMPLKNRAIMVQRSSLWVSNAAAITIN